MAKPVCGVNPSLIKEYNFDDHIWSVGKVDDDQVYDPIDLLELARKCVMVGDKYYLKIPNFRNSWRAYDSLNSAQKGAENSWKLEQLSSGMYVDDKMIETFFSGKEERIVECDKKADKKINVKVGSCPHLDNTISIPLGPQFVTYNERHCFNKDNTNILIGNEQDAISKDTQLFINLVYRSLCDQDEICENDDEQFCGILRQILSNNYSSLEFKLIMNWLAAIYQRPGINLQLNLWIVGEQNGVGKGTLAEVMKNILGPKSVGTLDKVEIEKGWTGNSLHGKVLVVWDEFVVETGMGRWKQSEWVNWMKEHTCEPQSAIKFKGRDVYFVINIGNHILFSNNLYPIIAFDPTDRRNAFLKTTDDPKWKKVASDIRALQEEHPDRWGSICRGFAWILENVEVDYEFLKTPPLTKHRIAIMNESKPLIKQVLDDIAVPERGVDGMEVFGKYEIPHNKLLTHEGIRLHINNYLGDKGIPEITSIRLSREIKAYFRKYDKEAGKLIDAKKPDVFGLYMETRKKVYYCITDNPNEYIANEFSEQYKKATASASKNKEEVAELQKALENEWR